MGPSQWTGNVGLVTSCSSIDYNLIAASLTDLVMRQQA